MTKLEEFMPFAPTFFRRKPELVARGLLGRFLVRELRGRALILRIVETEAYLGASDRASHAWRGQPTPRTETLFRAGGCAYVYLIYGLHNMFNVVAGRAGEGGAVLIRAGEPIEGLPTMRRLRSLGPGSPNQAIASGPGKLCQALAIDRSFDGASVATSPLWVGRMGRSRAVGAAKILVGPRVGVDYAGAAASWPLRFAVAGNRHVSRPAIDTNL